MAERGGSANEPELKDCRELFSDPRSELDGAVEGRLDFRPRDSFIGEMRDADNLRSREGSFQAEDGDIGMGLMGRGLVGTGGTATLTAGSECSRRGFAASLLTRASACSSTSRQRAQNSEKYLSSEVVCCVG